MEQLGDEARIEQATKILKLAYGQDTTWGHSGTVDDIGWRRVEQRILDIVDEIARKAHNNALEQVVRDIEIFDEELVNYPEGHCRFRLMVTGHWLEELKREVSK